MRIPIEMANVGEELTIVTWHKAVGDAVRKGELLLEVESEKFTVEVEALDEGTLIEIVVDVGSVAPGALIGYLEGAGS